MTRYIGSLFMHMALKLLVITKLLAAFAGLAPAVFVCIFGVSNP